MSDKTTPKKTIKRTPKKTEERNLGGRPVKFKTVGELQKAIDNYFDKDCMVDMGEYKAAQPTMAGLAYSLGLSRQGLLNYETKDGFFDAIKRARQRVEIALEQRLYGNAPTGAIFNLKNNFGWRDQKELEHSNPDGSMKMPSVVQLVAPKE